MGARINLLTVPRYNKDDQEALYKYLVAQSLELNRWFNTISFHDHDDTVGTDFSKISNSGIADNAAIAISKLAGGNDGSASGYFKIGNWLHQWGTGTTPVANSGGTAGAWYYSNQFTVTFPVAFKAASTPSFQLSIVGNTLNLLTAYNTLSNSAGVCRVYKLDNDGNAYTYTWSADGLIS